MDGLSEVLPPQHVNAQLHAQQVVQTNDGPLKIKVSHAEEVIGSHWHLSLNNMKGVGTVPPPLKAHFLYIASSFGASPTSIRG